MPDSGVRQFLQRLARTADQKIEPLHSALPRRVALFGVPIGLVAAGYLLQSQSVRAFMALVGCAAGVSLAAMASHWAIAGELRRFFRQNQQELVQHIRANLFEHGLLHSILSPVPQSALEKALGFQGRAPGQEDPAGLILLPQGTADNLAARLQRLLQHYRRCCRALGLAPYPATSERALWSWRVVEICSAAVLLLAASRLCSPPEVLPPGIGDIAIIPPGFLLTWMTLFFLSYSSLVFGISGSMALIELRKVALVSVLPAELDRLEAE